MKIRPLQFVARTFLSGIALASACSIASHAQPVESASSQPAGKWKDVSLEGYRAHLRELEAVTQACAKGRDLKSCDPALVGEDDEIPWRGQKRLVRYGWLRVLFSQALETDKATQDSDTAKRDGAPDDRSSSAQNADGDSDARSTSLLLKDAQARLVLDLDQADERSALVDAHEAQRRVLAQVLSGSEFRNLKQPNNKESALERFSNWLNRLFEGLGKLNVHSAWIGRLIIWGFFLGVGVALAWTLLQWERRWRVRLVLQSDTPASAAASARDWQLWFQDARDAAARNDWREAIHFLYWAAISRLESKRLWPADRARTPREYLALVAPEDPRRGGLGALTREFEWTWYGGRPAGEADYHRAEEMATRLFESGAAGVGGQRQ